MGADLNKPFEIRDNLDVLSQAINLDSGQKILSGEEKLTCLKFVDLAHRLWS